MTLFDIRVTTTVNRRVVGSSPTGGAKKSRETPVFLLFFTLLADPNRRPCHTQPHRLLTGSEHRAACGR